MSKTVLKRALFAFFLLAAVAVLGAALHMDPMHMAFGGGGGVAIAMAVVVGYGTGARDPASLKAIEGINAAAEERGINSLISIANGDSIASKYMVGEVPADAILDPRSFLTCTAITGVASADLGIANPNGGAMILQTALFTGQTLAAAATITLAGAAGSGIAVPANMAKRAWQLAGLATNPGGNLALWLTITAAATAAGTVWCHVDYDKGA